LTENKNSLKLKLHFWKTDLHGPCHYPKRPFVACLKFGLYFSCVQCVRETKTVAWDRVYVKVHGCIPCIAYLTN